jgi:cardiolipin synthase (CMP-forming)
MRLHDLGGDGTEQASDRILTVPNLLSFARLAVLPWLYIEAVRGNLLRALIIGMAFGATDWIDGYVARRFNQVTKLGQLLDPLSDRLFIITVAIALVVAGLLPWPIVAAIVLRDTVLLIAGIVLLGGGARPPAVTALGKYATFGLMWSFVPLLAGGIVGTVDDPEPILWTIGVVGLAISVILYYVVAVDYGRQLLAARRGTADADASPPG